MAEIAITFLALLLVGVWALCVFLMATAKERHPMFISRDMQKRVDKRLDSWYDKFTGLFKKTKPEDPMDFGC